MDFSHLHVTFYMDTVEDKNASAKAGRPIFEEVEMIKCQAAGDPKSVLVAPANSASSVRDAASNQRLTYAQLHREPYEAFKAGIEFIGSGTPIKELPFINAAKTRELQALGIHSAEALSGLDGQNLTRLGMGARELKNQATAWLESANGSADVTRFAAENAALKSQMEALQAQMAEMNGQAAPAQTSPPSLSPFAEWAKEDIVNWIVESGGEKPHHMCGHDKVMLLADELNATLTKQNEAA